MARSSTSGNARPTEMRSARKSPEWACGPLARTGRRYRIDAKLTAATPAARRQRNNTPALARRSLTTGLAGSQSPPRRLVLAGNSRMTICRRSGVIGFQRFCWAEAGIADSVRLRVNVDRRPARPDEVSVSPYTRWAGTEGSSPKPCDRRHRSRQTRMPQPPPATIRKRSRRGRSAPCL